MADKLQMWSKKPKVCVRFVQSDPTNFCNCLDASTAILDSSSMCLTQSLFRKASYTTSMKPMPSGVHLHCQTSVNVMNLPIYIGYPYPPAPDINAWNGYSIAGAVKSMSAKCPQILRDVRVHIIEHSCEISTPVSML
jgi:hypothetical protein